MRATMEAFSPKATSSKPNFSLGSLLLRRACSLAYHHTHSIGKYPVSMQRKRAANTGARPFQRQDVVALAEAGGWRMSTSGYPVGNQRYKCQSISHSSSSLRRASGSLTPLHFQCSGGARSIVSLLTFSQPQTLKRHTNEQWRWPKVSLTATTTARGTGRTSAALVSVTLKRFCSLSGRLPRRWISHTVSMSDSSTLERPHLRLGPLRSRR